MVLTSLKTPKTAENVRQKLGIIGNVGAVRNKFGNCSTSGNSWKSRNYRNCKKYAWELLKLGTLGTLENLGIIGTGRTIRSIGTVRNM